LDGASGQVLTSEALFFIKAQQHEKKAVPSPKINFLHFFSFRIANVVSAVAAARFVSIRPYFKRG
jgi:hypothetical protein